MGIINKAKRGGFMDQIRCDEPSYLIWKWHPEGSVPGKNNRENAIRWGSSLRVKESEVAVFVYNQGGGIMQDFIVGPYDQPIETYNFPVLAKIIGLAYAGGTPFQAEIYFINLARIIQVRFGVPYFDVYDPRFLDYGVPVAVRGTVSFRISDYEEFIRLHKLSAFNLNDFQRQIRDTVNRYVKDAVANAPAVHNIPVIQIESKTAQINDVIEYDISQRLRETFGVTVSGVDIGTIEIDKDSEGYHHLMSVTRDVTTATVHAEAEAKIKDISDKQRIEAENYEALLRAQREEAQYAQHKQTQSANMAAFQTEAQMNVGLAGADALGNMGANGAGNVDLSGGSSVFNPAAMMASMAVGGAVGQNIAETMTNRMVGNNQNVHSTATPPPIPETEYYVAANGKATGPFSVSALTQMAISGDFNTDNLVWAAGMSEWVKASAVDDLKIVFDSIPPMPPC